MSRKTVYVVLGPTASGKTDVAIALAKKLNGEVISADSMQIYKEMDIGTAKPNKEEREGIVHRLIDVALPDEPFSVAEYKQMAEAAIEDILGSEKTPIIAGGTGLYINSITYALDFGETKGDAALRARLSTLTNDQLYEKLLKLDSESAKRIHINDKKRLVRRLEILEGGGGETYDFSQQSEAYDFIIAGLTTDRDVLYERINLRVERMFERGLEAEARHIYNRYGAGLAAMQAIGYKEFIPYFEGGADIAIVREEIKRNTRRFAKRQLTWFKRDGRTRWYDIQKYANAEEIAGQIIVDGVKP